MALQDRIRAVGPYPTHAQCLLWLYLFHFGLMALSLEPGFLDFDNLPDTNFTCVGKVIGGYYADLETNCQMFHVCTIGQADEPMDIRFLCLNGTVFDQETRVCERIDEVDCSKSEQFYSLNLELYGNSGPILEESPESAPETDSPSIIIKSTTSTTTTTTTTTKRPSNRPTSPSYYTTIRPPTVTTTANKPKVVSTHHFPVNAPDIRFNPEEINISLNPGAPPDIRTKHFLPSFSDSSQDIVNDNVNSDEGQNFKVHKPERLHVSSSTSPKSIYSMDNNNHKLPQNIESFGFSDDEYQTEHPQRQQQFLIQTNSFRHSQSFPPNIDHNANQYHHQHFHSTTAKQDNNFHQDSAHTTLRTVYLHSLKPPEIHQHHRYTHHHHHYTERPPQRVQIPIPLLPTLPPLTFSSPAPFTLQRHLEAKRYTKDHQRPPRIIISASASVSDASGRRLNYSLGTIGAAHILKAPPASYDDYKDSDVGLDPFYHDVPKLNQKRRKRRSTEENEDKVNPFEVIKNEKEAVEVLKFLVTWYQSHQATATVPPVTSPVTPDLIHKINYELSAKGSDGILLTDSSGFHFTSSKEPTSTESFRPRYANSELFKKNGRYSIIGGYKNLHSRPKVKHRNYSRNSSDSALQNSDDEIRISKNIQVDNLVTEIFPDIATNILEKDADKIKINENIHIDEPVTEIISNLSANTVVKHDEGIRSGEDIQANDYITEIIPDMPELQEQMDDSEITVVKNLKATYFNPYDYVDDNYEGTVYKESSPNTTKENNTVYTYQPKQENNKTFSDSGESEQFSVNPTTAEELYKLFQIKRDSITENTKDDANDKDVNGEYHTPESTRNESEEIIESNEPLLRNTSSLINGTESFKYTELSEVPNSDDNFRSSTTTSTTSTTTTTESPYSTRNGVRRGRGRQRQYINRYNDGEKNLNTPAGSTELHKSERELELKAKKLENIDKHNLKQESSSTRSQSRRGRKRGRSRFVDYYNSTSTTTGSATPLLFSTPPILTESATETTTLEILENSTAATLKDTSFNDGTVLIDNITENRVADQNKLFSTNISEKVINSFSEEPTFEKSVPFNEPDNTFSNSETSSLDDIDFLDDTEHKDVNNIHKEPGNKPKNENDEILETEEKHFRDSATEHISEKVINSFSEEPTSEKSVQFSAPDNTFSNSDNSSLDDIDFLEDTEHEDVSNIHKERGNKPKNANDEILETEEKHFRDSVTENISEKVINSFSEELTFESSVPFNAPEDTLSNSENSSLDDIDFLKDTEQKNGSNIHKELENEPKNANDEILDTEEKHFRDSVTENYFLDKELLSDFRNMFTETVESKYETTSHTNSELMQAETTTISSVDQEKDNFSKNKGHFENTITTNSNYLQVETTTIASASTEMDHSSKTKETLESITELPPVVKTTEDSSYLMKLLRYYAETAINLKEESFTNESPVESYTPITESPTTTTEGTLVHAYHRGKTRNRVTEQKRGRQRSNYRHSSRTRTTSLPTLRYISEKEGSKKTEFEDDNLPIQPIVIGSTQTTNDSDPITIDYTTRLPLHVPDSELEENRHTNAKYELLEHPTLIEKRLEHKSSTAPVTKAPVAETTATTPFVSFEHLESFGTTIPSVTDPTNSIDAITEITKELTQMFEISTEPNFLAQSNPTANKNYYSFYEDVFVVPEYTEDSTRAAPTATNKILEGNTETTLITESPSISTTERSRNFFVTSTEESAKSSTEAAQTIIKLDSLSPHIKSDQHEPKTPKLENYINQSVNDKKIFHKLDVSTEQPDVEIQKSISLPVSVLETTFDISHDINNAQDINNLLPVTTTSEAPNTLRTTEKLQEYIQEIEVFTKSIVAKDDQIKLGFTEGYGLTATEIVPTTLITKGEPQQVNEATTINSIEDHVEDLRYSVVPEVRHNATEILFIKNTESPKNSDDDSTTNLLPSMPVQSPGTVNSSHLLEVVVETTTADPVTTILTTTRIPYHTRRTRPPKRRPYNNKKAPFGRHRFSTELFTQPPKHDQSQDKTLFTSQMESESITDAPLHRSATPTRSEIKKVSLHTTPLSSKSLRFPLKVNKQYVFNCFGKDKNKFYADPRDCRLFHYCTQGYSKNQLLDLKFVCDQKTFFDDDKLICTKVKPARCL